MYSRTEGTSDFILIPEIKTCQTDLFITDLVMGYLPKGVIKSLWRKIILSAIIMQWISDKH